MSTLRMWPIRVKNPTTGEIIKFIGQGTTLSEAVNDGIKNLGAPFRPKSDGKMAEPLRCAVTLPNGENVVRTIAQFESETPYNADENRPLPTSK